MIRSILTAAVIAPLLCQAQTKKPASPAKSATAAKPMTTATTGTAGMKSSLDSFSYAIGLNIAQNLKAQGVNNVNSTLLVKAFNDVFTNKQLAMDMQASNMVVQERFAKMAEAKSSVEKQAGQKFLEENKKRPGVKTTPSGLQYEILTTGTGPMPSDTNTVKVHYTGTLTSGKKFDSSVDRGQPIDLRVNGVIPGWTEALKMMPVGSKWKLYIPSELGYGDRGAGQDIPPGATLVFDVELISIVN